MLDFLKYYGRCDTYYKECMVFISHPGLTRVSSIIRFLQFEIKREDLFMLYFFLQNAYADKKAFKKKVKKKLCLMGQIVIESHSFMEY